jgi:hypothetical protein
LYECGVHQQGLDVLISILTHQQGGFRYFSIDKYQSIPGIEKIDKYRYLIDTLGIFACPRESDSATSAALKPMAKPYAQGLE